MPQSELIEQLNKYKRDELSQAELLNWLKTWPYEDLGFARLDHHRALRQGFPEVIFGQNKTPQHIAEIFDRLCHKNNCVLATRVGQENWQAIHARCPQAEYSELARCVVWNRPPADKGPVLIVSAGTADLPVAEEAAVCAAAMGNAVSRLYDVGVAGLHRLLDNLQQLEDAKVIIVIAGMDGALASVVGGLTDKPVIAVPTSVGYGASFQGLSALLAMLNSCASGISVVNIDNGYGAAAMADSITGLLAGSGK